MIGVMIAKDASVGPTKRPTLSSLVCASGGIRRAALGQRSARARSAMTKRPAKTMATAAASRPGRGSSTSAPVGPVSVRKPRMSENRPKATRAARPASLSAPLKSYAARDVVAGSGIGWSHLLHLRPAEDAGRKEDQDHDQDRERRDVLVLDGKIRRPQGLDQADQQSAKHGAGQRSDAAEHRGGEGLHPGMETEKEV